MGARHRKADHAPDGETVTAPIPLPPRGATGEVVDLTAGPGRRSGRRLLAAGLAAVAAVGIAVGVLVLPWPGSTPVAVAPVGAPASAPVAAPVGAPAPPVAPSPTTTTPRRSTAAPSCPSADRLLAAFRTAEPSYGTGARATGRVRCAGGFAVLSLRSATTPDGLRTIFAVGPPLRFLNAGTGPICTDGDESDGVVVPRSAAATLGCITSAPSTSARATSTPKPSASGKDPYGCLAERAAQDRSYEQGRPMPNSELRCNYNYGPTLPSTRAQCWLADHDRDESGFIDERARRDFARLCGPYGY